MKTWLQHSLHPLNLWCRVGGRFTFFFRVYEIYCWRPFLRRWLDRKDKRGRLYFSEQKNVDRQLCSVTHYNEPKDLGRKVRRR
jgi:hypothetical protein